MKFRLSLLSFLALFFLAACENSGFQQSRNPANAQPETAANPQESAYNLKEIIEKKGKNGLVEVSIEHDQYFKKPKAFLGFELRPILDSIIKANHFDTTDMLVVFECTDGYSPSMDLSKAYSDTKGYIVIKDKDAIGDNNWIDSLSSRFMPSYLVWQNVEPKNHSFPWPYGLVTMRLIPAASEYKTVYPFKNPEMVKGFTLFRDNCNKCHAINHVGGVMGPEFNVPKNITEYWKEEDIVQFVLNPKSYRSNSQMPPFQGVLSVEEIQIIIDYLKFVSKQKVLN